MGSTLSGLISLIIFALDIWAIISVLKSSAEMPIKIIWILVIIILPLIGLLIWAIAGPKGNVKI
ncbi:PLDc N-terminal domain-containing protein [Pseudomonas sp. CAN2814]|uniref:PLDc N-terminal domain-containing protein n=1 Tax=Pseudomonas sp. CAN1 TaxID=3046726 RepID=UPI00264806EF|nr:PLDc N-terminal domain-containing protein [Pseudomonas sp. CAN1]MDN6860816.1 PLDc N-terminal domain-containing protein [Pseudomonas sp. CAN1]